MSLGDLAEIDARLRETLPPWFGDTSPVLDAHLAGDAIALQEVFALLEYVRAQTRVRTATGEWLDLIAYDFFGFDLQRKTEESDDAYRARVLSSLARPRITRKAISDAIQMLTGAAPVIFEPQRSLDTGAYDVAGWAYGVNGGYGARLPMQSFIVVRDAQGAQYRSTAADGYNTIGGYGVDDTGYLEADQRFSSVQQQVLDLINSVKALGALVWVRFE